MLNSLNLKQYSELRYNYIQDTPKFLYEFSKSRKLTVIFHTAQDFKIFHLTRFRFQIFQITANLYGHVRTLNYLSLIDLIALFRYKTLFYAIITLTEVYILQNLQPRHTQVKRLVFFFPCRVRVSMETCDRAQLTNPNVISRSHKTDGITLTWFSNHPHLLHLILLLSIYANSRRYPVQMFLH